MKQQNLQFTKTKAANNNLKQCTPGYSISTSSSATQKQIIHHCISIELARLEGRIPLFIRHLLGNIRPQYPNFIFRFTQGFLNLHIQVIPTQPLDNPNEIITSLENAIKASC